MNNLERIKATLAFEPVDRVPVIPQIFGHSAILSGHTLLDYVKSGETAAKCQLIAQKRYQLDAVFAAIDVCIEAEAVGAEIHFPRDIYPSVKVHPFKVEQDFGQLELPNPTQSARMPQVLNMIERLHEAVGDETLVVGLLQGPMTLALQFLGIEQVLFLAADEPDRFEILLDYGTQLATDYGLAQIAAGAHVSLIFEPAGCPEVVPTAFFHELIGPRIKQICNAFSQAGAAANWLHIAGQTRTILPAYGSLGVDIGNFDYCVDPDDLISMLPAELTVDGNIKSLLFVDGSASDVMKESLSLIHKFQDRRGFILSSGCEIPPESKPENIEAMLKAALQAKT